MMDKKRPREGFPTKPVDGYETEEWRVDWYGYAVHITRVRYVYHHDRSWKEVMGADNDQVGAPFRHDWQVFEDGRFIARACGWDALKYHSQGSFPTYEAARREAIRRQRNTLKVWRGHVKDAEEALRALGAEP